MVVNTRRDHPLIFSLLLLLWKLAYPKNALLRCSVFSLWPAWDSHFVFGFAFKSILYEAMPALIHKYFSSIYIFLPRCVSPCIYLFYIVSVEFILWQNKSLSLSDLKQICFSLLQHIYYWSPEYLLWHPHFWSPGWQYRLSLEYCCSSWCGCDTLVEKTWWLYTSEVLRLSTESDA